MTEQLDQMLQDLSSEGRHEMSREFQLDADKARAKMQQFQLEDPHRYVLEFIQAIDDYKRAEGRPFPNWSEVLDIVKGLGYQRRV